MTNYMELITSQNDKMVKFLEKARKGEKMVKVKLKKEKKRKLERRCTNKTHRSRRPREQKLEPVNKTSSFKESRSNLTQCKVVLRKVGDLLTR